MDVKWRLLWFRREWPCGSIETEHVALGTDSAVFRATVRKLDDGGA